MKRINQAQELQFKLMELSSFNNFDGTAVSKDLKKHGDLWISCVWGRFKYFELIPLRDLRDGIYNADTLYIYTTQDKVQKIQELAKRWNADEFGVVTSTGSRGAVDFKPNETWAIFGATLENDRCLIRIWWD